LNGKGTPQKSKCCIGCINPTQSNVAQVTISQANIATVSCGDDSGNNYPKKKSLRISHYLIKNRSTSETNSQPGTRLAVLYVHSSSSLVFYS
jgi:hypothetical protein